MHHALLVLDASVPMHSPIHPPTHQSIQPPTRPFIDRSVHPSIQPSIHSSIVYTSVHQPTHSSIHTLTLCIHWRNSTIIISSSSNRDLVDGLCIRHTLSGHPLSSASSAACLSFSSIAVSAFPEDYDIELVSNLIKTL